MKFQKSEPMVAAATTLMMLYVISIMLGFPQLISVSLVLVLPIIVAAMIAAILKDKRKSDRTFEEYF